MLESVTYPDQLLVVHATDADAQLSDVDREKGYSTIRYLLRGENSDLFTMDPESGIMKVNNYCVTYKVC